jgi:hypothetical protein
MKKIAKALFLSLLVCITVNSFAQLQVPGGSSKLIPAGTSSHAPLGAIVQPSNTVFSYMPVNYDNAYTSDAGPGYKCYQSFSGATGPFRSITVWGLTDPAPSVPEQFKVEIYAAGATPGALLYSETVTIKPVATGNFVVGYPINCYNIPIATSTLTAGYISIEGISTTNTFYWLNSYATPSYVSFQNSVNLLTAEGCGLGMCLHNNDVTVPIPMWTIILGFVLIGGAVTFRFWRRMF